MRMFWGIEWDMLKILVLALNPASTFKSRHTSSQREESWRIDFLRLKHLWKLNKSNLIANMSELNT